MKRNTFFIAFLLIVSCAQPAVDTPADDSQQPEENKPHYTYLNAAEEREGIGPEDRQEYAAYTWRLERKNKDSLPSSFRTCMSDFKKRDSHNGYDPNYEPSRQGLDQLKISASSDFSEKELDALVAEIRKIHSGPITIVDLRAESHGLLNGYHVSRYGKNNWESIGLKKEDIMAAEAELFHSSVGKQVEVAELSSSTGYKPVNPIQLDVTTGETEAEACAKRGLGYLRLTILDHCFTDPQNLEDFIAFVQDLPSDTWLHFHCQAGKGRTTMYLVFYDFLRNPDVAEKDIIYRHYKQGGNFMYYQGDDPDESAYKVELSKEKAEMIPLVYKYIQENLATGFKVSWSQWKAQFAD